jgi:hypothetical protein
MSPARIHLGFLTLRLTLPSERRAAWQPAVEEFHDCGCPFLQRRRSRPAVRFKCQPRPDATERRLELKSGKRTNHRRQEQFSLRRSCLSRPCICKRKPKGTHPCDHIRLACAAQGSGGEREPNPSLQRKGPRRNCSPGPNDLRMKIPLGQSWADPPPATHASTATLTTNRQTQTVRTNALDVPRCTAAVASEEHTAPGRAVDHQKSVCTESKENPAALLKRGATPVAGLPCLGACTTRTLAKSSYFRLRWPCSTETSPSAAVS